jgi:hypothetical protein
MYASRMGDVEDRLRPARGIVWGVIFGLAAWGLIGLAVWWML